MHGPIPNLTYKGVDVVLSKPYPKVADVKEDIALKEDFKRLYASSLSELMCVLCYTHQADVLGPSNETARVLYTIGMVERKHLSLLAEVLCKMGAKCDYCFAPDPLLLEDLDYEVTEAEVIRKNIEREYRIAAQYERLIALCSTPALKELLRRILQDEKKHHEIFTLLYQDRN